jgi:hypothetical protein
MPALDTRDRGPWVLKYSADLAEGRHERQIKS